MPPYIVAEVSKTYRAGHPMGAPEPVAVLFEQIIEVNRQRGYRLNSWQLHRLYRSVLVPMKHSALVLEEIEELQETIVAVFEVMQ